MRPFLIAAALLVWFVPALGQAPIRTASSPSATSTALTTSSRASSARRPRRREARLVRRPDDHGPDRRLRRSRRRCPPGPRFADAAEEEAKSAGGQLVILLGDHEVMNLIGDWRDATPEICAAFANPPADDGCVAYRAGDEPRAGPTGGGCETSTSRRKWATRCSCMRG